jgi:hypothetical protein
MQHGISVAALKQTEPVMKCDEMHKPWRLENEPKAENHAVEPKGQNEW